MSARLAEIISSIVPADTVADVGCDHGLIAEYCVQSGMFKTVIASDISVKCLQKAKNRLAGSEVVFKLCDGIAYECDEAIIAGIGGITVSGIIKSAEHKPKTLILCPHTDCAEVRQTLIDVGYGIDRDVNIGERGKFYSVIRAIYGGGNMSPSRLQILFGDCETPSAALKAHLRRLYDAYNNAPKANAARLDDVRAAMRLQNMTE